jgi:O-antigen biosynthesis protein
MNKVDVVIPIYNNVSQLRTLLESLESEINSINKLILIDDFSNTETRRFIENYTKACPYVISKRNSRNIGFTGSANLGLSLSTKNVLLVNTDVIFPKGGLPRLQKEIDSRGLATVTALCDTPHTYASISISDMQIYRNSHLLPSIIHSIKLITIKDVNKYNSIWRFVSFFFPNREHYVPTCIGFCVLIKASSLESVSFFDEHRFEFGYGEEIDWSFKASRKGFKHILSRSVVVHHSGGASFQSRTEELSRKHSETLTELYPEYPDILNNYKHSPIRFFIVLITNMIYKTLSKIS